MPVVVGNKFQRRMQETHRESLAPGTGTRHSTTGVLIEVYDQERLETMQVSKDLADKINAAPGLLFAKVLLTGEPTPRILPFKEAEDAIYLTYGNGFHLEGRAVKIQWQGMSVESGVIELARSWAERQIHIPRESATLDIGNIL